MCGMFTEGGAVMNIFSRLGLVLVLLLAMAGCGREEGAEMETPGDNLKAGPVSLDESKMTAELSGGALEVFFPLENLGNAKMRGDIEVECRELDGEFLSKGESSFVLKPGTDTVAVPMSAAPELAGTADQARFVVSYKVHLDTGKLHGKRSLFMLLDKADLIVLVPDKLLLGQATKLRSILLDPRTQAPIPDRKIVIQTLAPGGEKNSYEETTDSRGVAVIEVPADSDGELELKAMVFGDDESALDAQVQVVRESRLLLTTDKPMYQPGQLMHLRALALNRLDKAPLAAEPLVFEVMDANGNKVFKRADQTNEFGVGWAQFQLATQVVLGSWTIRATVGDVVSEKTVTVDRYALPKFKVQATLDKPFYQPGATIAGEVKADYFFGKPVSGGKVKVTVFNYVAEWAPETEISGELNDEGLYSFKYTLPEYLIGQPLEDGKALVMLEIAVTDGAEHEQKVAKTVVVTQNALDIALIPESTDVIPEVVNYFYLFVSDPTGAPTDAVCNLTVNGAELDDEGAEVVMPPKGPAKVAFLPHAGVLKVDVKATNAQGSSATRSFNYSVGENPAAILLRTDKSLYNVGELMNVTAYITGGYSHIFLDVIRKNQTVLTKTLEAVDGVADLLVDLDSEMTEDLVIDAYFMADSGQFIRDSRLVYVQAANDLDISVKADKDEYLPGETATIKFAVRDQQDKPIQTALGLQVVDEAVFALAEMNPGLMKLYFMLEEELQTPSYQIGPAGGFSIGGLIMEGNEAPAGSEDEKAVQDTTTAAFAAMGSTPSDQTQLSSWKDVLQEVVAAIAPLFESQKEAMRAKLETMLADSGTDYDTACSYLKEETSTPAFFDFWGNAFVFSVSGTDWWDCAIEIKSAGPDERLETADDWSSKLSLYDLNGERWEAPMAMAGGGEEDGEWAFDANAGPPNEEQKGAHDETSGGGSKDSVKVRKWFPETLFVQPSLITDNGGEAEVEIPLADSITEWRMTTMANSTAGHLGSRTDGIVVFQDFFVDIDFPKFLTQNDEISFPIAVYNYLEENQKVNVELQPEEWFDVLGETSHSLDLEPGEVSVVYFPVRVNKVGWHSLTVYGMGDKLQDAVQRTVEVKPDGKEIAFTESARFDNDGENKSSDHITMPILFPDNSIENSQTVVVKVLPGLSSHIVEGMESMLQLPGG